MRMSLPGRRRLAGDDRIDVRIEEHRLKPREQLIERFALLQREAGARLFGRVRRRRERVRRAAQHELARRQVVVRTVVDPEELGVALDLVERRLVDLSRGCVTIASSTSRISRFGAYRLIVEDVAAGERRLIQMPDERLFLQRQRLKAVGIDLHDGRLVNALEQVRPFGPSAAGAGGRSGRVRGVARPAGGGSNYRHDGDGPLQHGTRPLNRICAHQT